MIGGLAKPERGRMIVTLRTLAVCIHDSDAVLSLGITSVRSLLDPVQSCLQIMRHALCVKICQSEIELSVSQPLFGSHTKPLGGFDVVWRHTQSICI